MIGRDKEVKELKKLYESDKSEFVAVYGRRRVGKTYLIDETFKDEIVFRHTGLANNNINGKSLLKAELNEFYNSLIRCGANIKKRPKDWSEAFILLENFLNSFPINKRLVVFIDELPWMDTPRSNFLLALESFWNNYGTLKKNLLLIVCGSAASWMLDNLINNYGGLYNRLTYKIKLKPFTLTECEEYLTYKKIEYSRFNILLIYMCLGGIPYYLGYLDKSKSALQNIDDLFFKENSILKNEFNLLFSSIFQNDETMKKIVTFIGSKKIGYTREEISKYLNIKSGGVLSKNLETLIESDFLIKYKPIGKKEKDMYKLNDLFSIFCLKFLKEKQEENLFEQKFDTSLISSWCGLTFEIVCFNHINKIKESLSILGVSSSISTLNEKDENKGAQIDLIIERSDNVVNMCEIKFNKDVEFEINKDYYDKLNNKNSVLSNYLKPRQYIQDVLISTNGLKRNKYSDFFIYSLTLNDLF